MEWWKLLGTALIFWNCCLKHDGICFMIIFLWCHAKGVFGWWTQGASLSRCFGPNEISAPWKAPRLGCNVECNSSQPHCVRLLIHFFFLLARWYFLMDGNADEFATSWPLLIIWWLDLLTLSSIVSDDHFSSSPLISMKSHIISEHETPQLLVPPPFAPLFFFTLSFQTALLPFHFLITFQF